MKDNYSCPEDEEDILFRPDYVHPDHDEECLECCDTDNASNLVARCLRRKGGPKIWYGTIASGNVVMKDGLMRDKLAKDLKALCFEMEAAGLMNDFSCLVIRGVCDYADSHKNKAWQRHAALVAAAYAKDLLLKIPGTHRG